MTWRRIAVPADRGTVGSSIARTLDVMDEPEPGAEPGPDAAGREPREAGEGDEPDTAARGDATGPAFERPVDKFRRTAAGTAIGGGDVRSP